MDKASFFARNKLPIREVEIPDHGTFFVKAWSNIYQEYYDTMPDSKSDSDFHKYRVGVAMTVCDESGNRFLVSGHDQKTGYPAIATDDLDELREMPQQVLATLLKTVGELNLASKKDIADTKKK